MRRVQNAKWTLKAAARHGDRARIGLREGGVQATLVTAGLVCVIAAIVGGGLKAFQIEVPGIASVPRQAMLAAFGVLIGVIGLAGGGDNSGNGGGGDGGSADSTSALTTRTTARPTTTAIRLPPASGRGNVAHCRTAVVTIAALERSEGTVTFNISVKNEGAATIDLPTLDKLFLVDAAGKQWPTDQFGNLGGRWELGPKVAPGGTVDVDVAFDPPNGAVSPGSLTVREISLADNPFSRCDIKVSGVALPV